MMPSPNIWVTVPSEQCTAFIICSTAGSNIQASIHQTLLRCDTIAVIKPQKPYRHPCLRREGANDCPVPRKMRRPLLRTRIEQGNEQTCQRIERTDIGFLVPITAQTRQGKIALVSFSTMLTRHNVIWFMLMEGYCLR
jgi:hypothetical protein